MVVHCTYCVDETCETSCRVAERKTLRGISPQWPIIAPSIGHVYTCVSLSPTSNKQQHIQLKRQSTPLPLVLTDALPVRHKTMHLQISPYLLWSSFVVGCAYAANDVSVLIKENAKANNESLLWGPYKPNLYFGVRPRIPKSLTAGLMWAKVDDYATAQASTWLIPF